MNNERDDKAYREYITKKTSEALKEGKPSLTFNLGDEIRRQAEKRTEKK